MTTRIKLRRDTAANWENADPVLALGEAGYDTTNNQLRVGDGTSVWTSLNSIGGGAEGFTALTLTGTIPYTNGNILGTPVSFTRPNNSINTVDNIDTGLAIKRGNNGAIYNSAGNIETQWDSDQSPLGTEWNSDGWGDLTDVQARKYTTFYEATGGNNNLGSVVTHKEFVMHDTINDKYYKIDFNWWQPNNGGGANLPLNDRSGFSYTRTLIDTTKVTYFVRLGDDSTIVVDEVDDGLVITRDSAGGIYNTVADLEGWDPDVSPTGTLWNDDGWDDFTDITTRTWKPLYAAVHGQLGNHLVGSELLMNDTINDKYYIVKFTDWGQNNGGSFAYYRREINPIGTKLGITFTDGSVQKTAFDTGEVTFRDNRISLANNDLTITTTADPLVDADIGIYAANDLYLWANGGETEIAATNEVRIVSGDQELVDGYYVGTPTWNGSNVIINDYNSETERSLQKYLTGTYAVWFRTEAANKWYKTSSTGNATYNGETTTYTIPVAVTNDGDPLSINDLLLRDPDWSGNTQWEFNRNGILQPPFANNTGYAYDYGLNGPTLKLGVSTDQVIITGPVPTVNDPNSQRIVIQGQRGFGEFGQNTSGEGGDVYIWGGVGGESDNGGSSGGDIKVRGGQGQNNQGGYVRIEGGHAAHWDSGNSGDGGFIDIRAGDVTESGGLDTNRGGDITISAGRARNDEDNSGEVKVYTGGISTDPGNTYEWKFTNSGDLIIPPGGNIMDPASGVSAFKRETWVNSLAYPTETNISPWIVTSVEYDSTGNVFALVLNYQDSGPSSSFTSVVKFSSSGEILGQVEYADTYDIDGWGLAVDSSDNVYVTGTFSDANQDIFVTKLDNDLTELWLNTYGDSDSSLSDEEAAVIDVGSDNNPVLVGRTNINSGDILVMKISGGSNGDILWQRTLGGAGTSEEGIGMAIGPDNEVIVVGTATADGGQIYQVVAKYNSSGTIVWQKLIEIDEATDCTGADADVDLDGNIYVLGSFEYGPPLEGLTITKLNSSGAAQWTRKVSGPCGDVAASIVFKDGYLYASGTSSIVLDNGDLKFNQVIAKYDTDGEILWQRYFKHNTSWIVSVDLFGSSFGSGSSLAVHKDRFALGSGRISNFVEQGPLSWNGVVFQGNTIGEEETIGSFKFEASNLTGVLGSPFSVTNAGFTDSAASLDKVTESSIQASGNIVATKHNVGSAVTFSDGSNLDTAGLGRHSVDTGDNIITIGAEHNGKFVYFSGDNGNSTVRVPNNDNVQLPIGFKVTFVLDEFDGNTVYVNTDGDTSSGLHIAATGVDAGYSNNNDWRFGGNGDVGIYTLLKVNVNRWILDGPGIVDNN